MIKDNFAGVLLWFSIFFNWSNKLAKVVKTVCFGFKTELVAFKVVEIFYCKK